MTLALIHPVYPSSLFMERFKTGTSELCSWCQQTPEDLQHLFWSCPDLQPFWQKITNLSVNTYIKKKKQQNFSWTQLFFFFSLRKFTYQTSCFSWVEKEIKPYIITISQPENKNHKDPGSMCFVPLLLRWPFTFCFSWSLLLHTLI